MMASTLVLTENNTLETSLRLRPGSPETPEQNERDTEIVILEDCSRSLGIKVIGGRSDEYDRYFGLFIKRVLPGGLADTDGRIQEGDQILSVNDESLRNTTNDKGVALLRKASASNYMKLVLARDEKARQEYADLLESQHGNSYSTSVSVMSSRASTPALSLPQGNLPWYPQDALPADDQSSQGSNRSGQSTPHYEENQNYQDQYSREDPSIQSSYPLTMSSESPNIMTVPKYAPPPIPPAMGIRAQPNMVSTPHYNTDGYAQGASSNGARRTSDPSTHTYSSITHPLSEMSNTLDPSPVMPASRGQSGAMTLPARTSKPSKIHSDLKKGSVDPYSKFKVEKLEVALHYLGVDPSPEQQLELRRQLKIDESGAVNYQHFVQVAQEVFKYELKNMNNSQGAMYISAQDITDFTEPPQYNPDFHQSKYLPPYDDDSEQVRRERDELQRENDRLRLQLREKEQSCSRAEEELLRIRRDAQGAIHETRSLRSKIYLAQQAQKAAMSMEHDYEEVVRLLESEIAELKSQQAKQMENPDVQKKIQVLNGQIRKAEVGKKTYEVATDKLLQFAQLVHSTLSSQDTPASSLTKSGPTKPGRPPGYLDKHKKMSPQALAQEAKDVVKAVNSLIEADPLPHGWEEAYSPEGIRYFIKEDQDALSPLRCPSESCEPDYDLVPSRLPRAAPPQRRGFQETHPGNTDVALYSGLDLGRRQSEA
ncbi:afadin-like isoform X3 [Lineus longissimus]|uniref:afadin-like isoform X3 n=1 Tax=Lineus longissimus TaxID=88925 RepID=UPI00315D5235